MRRKRVIAKGNLGRLGMLCLVLVVALGGMGVGYAQMQGGLQSNGQVLSNCAFTWVVSNDDGAEEDRGGYTPIDLGDDSGGTSYDRWDAQSSDDPSEAQEMGIPCVRYDKDVARTTAQMVEEGRQITVLVENAYPSYYPTVFFGMWCGGSGPGTITSIVIKNDYSQELTVTTSGIYPGQPIPQGEEVTGAVHVHVEQAAAQNEVYTFTVSITIEHSPEATTLVLLPETGENPVGTTHDLTATVRDQFNNVMEGVAVTWSITGVGSFSGTPESPTDVNGEADAVITSSVPEMSTVRCEVTGNPSVSATATKDWTLEPPVPIITLVLMPATGSNPVDTTHSLTATVRDQFNNVMAGVAVTWSITGVGSFSSTPESPTDVNGEADAVITSSVPGTSTVKCEVTGNPSVCDTATKDWTLEPPVPITLVLMPPTGSNLVGTTHSLTATVRDQFNNVMAGVAVTWSISGIGSFSGTPESPTDVNGEADAVITSSVPGTSTVGCEVTGSPSVCDTATKTWWTLEPPVPITLVLLPESDTNPVDTTHSLTATVRDQFNNVMAGVAVTWSITGVGSFSGTPEGVTDADGQADAVITSSVPGTSTVTCAVTEDTEIYDTATKTWTAGGGPGAGALAAGCPLTRYLTVDWEGNNTTKPLYSNDHLVVDLPGLGPDGSHSLLLERGTLAPTVNGKRHYLIVIRELEEIPPPPENTIAIMAFNVTPVDAVFDRDIFLTLGLDQAQLPENALNVTMAYYDDVNGVWVPLDSELGGPNGVAELTLSAAINHFSIFGVLAELAPPGSRPAHFVASGLNIVPGVERIWEPVTFVTKTGESATVTVNIANDGGQAGTYTVELKLNGEIVDSETVMLGAGQSREVSFALSEMDYGQYQVEVAGVSGTFTVSRTITWWLIVGILVAIGLIGWVVARDRRKRKAHKEA